MENAPASGPRSGNGARVPNWLVHGGAIDVAAETYGVPAGRWLDLSTGINPRPYPLARLEPALWRRLPTAALSRALSAAAARHYGCPPATGIVAVPGSQAAIQWVPRLLPSARVAVLGPTYAPHEDAWRAAGHDVARIASLDALPARCTVVVVVNPNNPDGRVVAPARLLALSGRVCVVVDEAFADVHPAASIAGAAASRSRIVLRSFGKFFGLAGLRLGFVLADRAFAARLDAAQGPWAVSGLAQAIGARALADTAWIEHTRRRLGRTATRLRALLANRGLEVVGGTDLFVLAATADAAALFDHLARAAILVRAFADQPHRLRFGLPGSTQDFARLSAALDAWADGNRRRRAPASPPTEREPGRG
jgi:cobalamin biosynthetic protein CobC